MSKGDRDRTTDRGAFRENFEKIRWDAAEGEGSSEPNQAEAVAPDKDHQEEDDRPIGWVGETPVVVVDPADPNTALLVTPLPDGRLHIAPIPAGAEILDGEEAQSMRRFLQQKGPA